jgi:predicted nucleotidyltransferase
MNTGVDLESKRAQIADICQRYGVRELLLFGSALDSRFQADSDIDLLVDFHPSSRIGLIRLVQLQAEFERVLGRTVDLVPKNGLKPLVRASVLQHTEPVYAG